MKLDIVRVSCDLCGEEDEYLTGRHVDGWMVDEWPNGDLLDLCPECAKDAPEARPVDLGDPK